jgi:hypothetical protein
VKVPYPGNNIESHKAVELQKLPKRPELPWSGPEHQVDYLEDVTLSQLLKTDISAPLRTSLAGQPPDVTELPGAAGAISLPKRQTGSDMTTLESKRVIMAERTVNLESGNETGGE